MQIVGWGKALRLAGVAGRQERPGDQDRGVLSGTKSKNLALPAGFSVELQGLALEKPAGLLVSGSVVVAIVEASA